LCGLLFQINFAVKASKVNLSLEAVEGCKKSIVNFCLGSECFGEFGLSSVVNYQWPPEGKAKSKSIDELLAEYDTKLVLSGTSNYEKNVSLKILLSKEFKNGRLDVPAISRWIINRWGGISKVSKSINKYIRCAETKTVPEKLDGVASYSKLFAMFYPDEFAIYDARVAVSLNIVQLISKETHNVFFPYLSGRNKTTGNQTTGSGFSNLDDFKRKRIEHTSNKNWDFLPSKDVYKSFNAILLEVCKEQNWKLWDVEMLLFSKAEDLVKAIRKDQKFSDINWKAVQL
jgi:hypothetical protein